MSLLPDDGEFALHDSYAQDEDMGFPNDFGAEEIGAELMVTEDHQYEVEMQADIKQEMHPESDLLIESAEESCEAGVAGDNSVGDDQHHFSHHQEEDEVGHDYVEEPDYACDDQVEDNCTSEQDPANDFADEEDESRQQQEQQEEEVHESTNVRQDVRIKTEKKYVQQQTATRTSPQVEYEELHDQGHDDDADEDFEKNLLEPEVYLSEEEQPISPKTSFRPKSGSAQPNVVRRFPRQPVGGKQNYNSYNNGCSSGEEDDEDYLDGGLSGKDDRRGCRSLVCDSNSIIIAEMVYRCLICAHVTESIGEAQKHYHRKHMKKEKCSTKQTRNKQPPAPPVPVDPVEDNFDAPGAEDDELDNPEEEFSSEDVDGFATQQQQSTVTFNVPSGLKQLQQTMTPTHDSGGDSRPVKKPGNFVYSPSPADYVPGRNSNRGQSSQSNGNTCARGGYVTCAVCNITKYYASVQRRYGQFTCMGCAKFFGRFLLKPRRYYCLTLGSCPLNVSPRCKACLLLACINTYNIDDKRMKIVNANRPLKKSGQNNSCRPQVLTSINTQPQSSVTRPSVSSGPPLLVKAPASPRQSVPGFQQQQPPQRSQQFRSNDFVKSEPQTSAPVLRQQQQSGYQQQQRLATRQPVRNSVMSSNSSLNHNVTPAASTATSSPAMPSSLSSGRKGTGCRSCPNCLADDCGSCNYCLDKPKFGGPNTLKKKCINKKCLLIQPNSNSRMRLIRKN